MTLYFKHICINCLVLVVNGKEMVGREEPEVYGGSGGPREIEAGAIQLEENATLTRIPHRQSVNSMWPSS